MLSLYVQGGGTPITLVFDFAPKIFPLKSFHFAIFQFTLGQYFRKTGSPLWQLFLVQIQLSKCCDLKYPLDTLKGARSTIVGSITLQETRSFYKKVKERSRSRSPLLLTTGNGLLLLLNWRPHLFVAILTHLKYYSTVW